MLVLVLKHELISVKMYGPEVTSAGRHGTITSMGSLKTHFFVVPL